MKMSAIIASSLVAFAAAQSTNSAAAQYTDSQPQTKNLVTTDGSISVGTLTWFTRFWPSKDSKTNYTEIHFQCNPLKDGNVGFVLADNNDQLLKCQVGIITPLENGGQNLADLCRAQAKVFTNGNIRPEGEVRDGRLNNYQVRPVDQKWNFEDDPNDRQDCKWIEQEPLN